MENWIYIISVISSLLLGLKLKSNCCGKMCEFSIEKSKNNDEVLRSIRITKRSKVKPRTPISKDMKKDSDDKSDDGVDDKSEDSWAEELRNLPEIK